jgi:hypothetical protein
MNTIPYELAAFDFLLAGTIWWIASIFGFGAFYGFLLMTISLIVFIVNMLILN